MILNSTALAAAGCLVNIAPSQIASLNDQDRTAAAKQDVVV
jgi:hypothetical protein